MSFEVVTVSDGSTDGSDRLISAIDDPRVHNMCLPVNEGKGEALRTGLAMADGRFCGFIDGDGDIDPEQVASFCSVFASLGETVDVIVGSKRHPASEVVYPAARRVYSFGFQLLTRFLFGLNIRDTQVGLKFFRREVLADVLPRTVERRFVFDLELLALSAHLGYRRCVEMPVRIGQRFGSTIDTRAVCGMLADIARIWWRLRIGRHYYQ